MGITKEEFAASEGKPCSVCGRLSLRLPRGMCMGCWGRAQVDQAEAQGEKVERRYFKRLVSRGIITVSELRDGRVPGEKRHDREEREDVGQED